MSSLTARDLVMVAKSKGLTEHQIAKMTDTSQPTISRYISDCTSLSGKCDRKISYRLKHHLQHVSFGGEDFYLMEAV